MNYATQTTHKVAPRTILAMGLLAIAVLLSIVWIQATGAQAPIAQSPGGDVTTTNVTPQGCQPTWNIVPTQNVGTGDNYLTGIEAIMPSDVWAVGYYTGTGRYLTLIQHWDGTAWSVVPSPNPGTADNYIYGINALAPNNVWAVGKYSNEPPNDASNVMTLHWNGTQWGVVPNGDPGGSNASALYAARAYTPMDMWAVGYYSSSTSLDLRMYWTAGWTVSQTPTIPYGYLYGVGGVSLADTWAVGSKYESGYQTPLVEHLLGNTWSVVPAPAPAGNSFLDAVASVANNDIWAVGATGFYTAAQQSLAEHWDGFAWSIVNVPDVGKLTGIKALATDNVWVTGNGAILHWDGTTWETTIDQANGELMGIDAMTPGDIWVAGTQYVGGVKKTLVERYMPICEPGTPTITPSVTPCAHAWTEVPGQNVGPDDNVLNAVAVLAPDDVWAVGYYTDTNSMRTLTLHWDGTQWSVVPSPSYGSSSVLRGVSGTASDDVWAVGSHDNHLLTIHWDGDQWNDVPNPDPGGNYANWLDGVKAFAPSNVWAVGLYRYTQPLELIMQWDGTQWVVGGSPTGATSDLLAVDGLTPSDAWAVGWTSLNGFGGPVSLFEHWHNGYWSVMTSGLTGTANQMNAVTMISSDDVWAAGYYDDDGTKVSMFQHWHNGYWTIYTLPDSMNVGELFGVQAISADDVWAVGSGDFLRWDGTSWNAITNPVSGTLRAVDSISPDDMWAVGWKIVGGVKRTLIERYQSACAPPTATPTSTMAITNTPTSTNTATPQPTATSCAIEFSDVVEGSTFYPYVKCLACGGIVEGYEDGTYRPNNAVTRGQAAKIIANSAGWSDEIQPQQQTFNDVPTGSTFWLYIERAYMHGAIGGYECGGVGEPCPGVYFRPANTVTRGQIAKIASIAAGYDETIPPQQQTFNDVMPDSTFWLYIERVALHGVVNGYTDGTFRPQNPVTRGQIAKIAAIAFFPDCDVLERYRE